FANYECHYAKTLVFEGMRYSYAISDNETDSFAFREIIDEQQNKFHNRLINIIDELFDIEIFQLWMDSKEKASLKASNIYSDYIRPENVFKEIEKVLNLSPAEMIKHDLYANFNRIWDHEFEVNLKVCHGDLH